MAKPEDLYFDSPEALIDHIKQHADDISEVTLAVARDISMDGPQGQNRVFPDSCGLVMHIGGNSFVISARAAEGLLNDGLLTRLRVSVRLLPQQTSDSSSSQEEGR